jgi:multidrug efflux system membrane fusion protein
LREVNRAFAEGPLEVDAMSGDSANVIDKGTLEVVNNQVDSTTGTVQLKAQFPNERLQLWPGQFTNVRLLIRTLRNVVVVPAAAIQRGPNGTFVFVAQPDQTVAQRAVTLTQQDESRAVIASGVQAGDDVVTSGFNQLSNGARVRVSRPGQAPAEGQGAAGPDEARERRGGEAGPGGFPKNGKERRRKSESDPGRQSGTQP